MAAIQNINNVIISQRVFCPSKRRVVTTSESGWKLKAFWKTDLVFILWDLFYRKHPRTYCRPIAGSSSCPILRSKIFPPRDVKSRHYPPYGKPYKLWQKQIRAVPMPPDSFCFPGQEKAAVKHSVQFFYLQSLHFYLQSWSITLDVYQSNFAEPTFDMIWKIAIMCAITLCFLMLVFFALPVIPQIKTKPSKKSRSSLKIKR